MMRRNTWMLGLLLAAGAIVSGCNSRVGGEDADPTPNPLAGSFSGDWTSDAFGEGKISLVIPTSGTTTGSWDYVTPDFPAGPITGVVSHAGVTDVVVTIPGQAPFRCQGNLALAGEDKELKGTLNRADGDGAIRPIQVSMVKN